MGGTLTLWSGESQHTSTPLGEGTDVGPSLIFCTLLGPEGPGRRAVSQDTA